MQLRNRTIDIAKGIAGVLVVAGHAMAFRYQTGWLLQLTHLATPLFIFLSGIFFNPHQPWSAFLSRKADGLLKPYLVVLLGWAAVHAVIGTMHWLPYLAGVFYGSGATIVLVPLWFIPHLFLCLLAARALDGFCSRLSLPPGWRWLLAGAMLVAGAQTVELVWRQPLPPGMWQALLGPASHWPGLPFSADVLLLTLPALLAGQWLSLAAKEVCFSAWHFLLSMVVLVWSLTVADPLLDINRRIYHDVLFSTLFVAAGIYVVLSLAALLSAVAVVARALAYVGRNFLLILLLHLLVLRWLFSRLQENWPELVVWHVPLAFAAGMLLSVLLVELVQRNRWLACLLLPLAGKPAGERRR